MGVSFQEYLTGNEQVAYPFREDSPALIDHGGTAAHGPTAMIPKDFLIDAVIITPSPFHGQVFLSEIVDAGGGAYDFYLFSEERRVVAAFSITSVPPERSVIAVSDAASGVVVRLLTGPSFASFLAGVVTVDEFGGTLPFETAAVEFRPRRVEKFIIENDVPETVTGSATFLAGFNMQYTVGDLLGFETDEVDTTVLNIAAVPGAGAGRYNPCDDLPEPIDYIAKINGVGPDMDGNLFLKPVQCHRLDLMPDINTIFFYNDCTPCCECEDYANVVSVLNRLFKRLREVKLLLDEVIEDFNEHVTIYNDELWKRYRSVFLTGNGQQGLSNDMEGMQKPKSGNYASLVFHMNNRSCVDITDVRLKGTTDKEFEVIQLMRGLQAPVGHGDTTSDYEVDSTFGVAVDVFWQDLVRAGSDASLYFLLKREFPEVASGTASVYVCYTVGTDTFETDPITVTW